MSFPHNRWIDPKPVPAAAAAELSAFSRPFRSILYQRGYSSSVDAVDFLLPAKPGWTETIKLRHLDLGVDLIHQAVEAGQPIAVFGDYDADGLTATALLTLALRKIHSPIIPEVPNRLDDGYGLSIPAIDALHEQGVKLIITVDNGIRSHQEVARAKELGMKVIITDHHTPPLLLPEADAVINPKLADESYPNKHLAGVGVAYKLAAALAERFPLIDAEEYLDLVAIGTVADIVPLQGENRYLVKQGLREINRQPRQAIHSLLGVSGLSVREFSSTDISFQIAPRLNSTSRLGVSDHLAPLNLLLSADPALCGNLAQVLEIHNLERRQKSAQLQQDLDAEFQARDTLPPLLIALAEGVDLGVAGIAAGFLSRKYYLPAVVGRTGPSTTTASCRSIPEFNLIKALERHQDLFLQFGGHKLAAGFTIHNSRLGELTAGLTELAQDTFSGMDLQPELQIDAEVTLSELDRSFYQELEKLEPTGEGNHLPILRAKNLTRAQVRRIGKNRHHLKLLVRDDRLSFPAIGFGLGTQADLIPDRFDAAFHFTENQYRGRKEFQLQILDLRPA